MSYKQARAVNQGVFYTLGTDFASVKASECTWIFVWNPASLNPQGLFRVTHSGTPGEGINPYSDGKIYYTLSGFSASTATYTATDGWRVDVIRKSSGSAKPRHSYYLYNEGVWHHSDFNDLMNDSTTTGFDGLQLWAFNPGGAEVMDGRAAGACIVKSILSDSDCVGLEKGIPEWMTRGYPWMVSHQEAPNETTTLNVPAKPFGSAASASAFVSFGQFGAGGMTWPPGFATPFLSTQYNPPAPWSYAKQAETAGVRSLFKQRLTFKGTRGDAAGWTLGNQMSLVGDGSITAIWWYPPDGFIGDFTWRIYQGDRTVSGPQLATGTVLSADYDHAGGWLRFPISPVDVSHLNFMVCYDAPGSGNGSYIYCPMDNDHLPPGANDLNDGVLYLNKGCFASSHTRPDTDSGNAFGIDVEITPPGGGSSYNTRQFFPYFN